MFEALKPSDILKRQCGILRKSSSTRPLLRVIEEHGKRAVVKDFSVNGLLFRNIAGRFLVWREKRAYQRLTGIKGIPTFYGTVKGPALVMEEITGKNLHAVHQTSGIPQQFYSDLNALLKAIHDAGLAHCDLKRAPNIIMGEDGRPYIVDWSASISRNEFRFFPLSVIYMRFVRDDLNAIVKLKLKYNPELVSPEERAGYLERGIFERLIRDIRDKSRKFLKKIA